MYQDNANLIGPKHIGGRALRDVAAIASRISPSYGCPASGVLDEAIPLWSARRGICPGLVTRDRLRTHRANQSSFRATACLTRACAE